MPNGKPGDHPYTDILAHGADLGEPEIASLVRSLEKVDDLDVQNLIADLLWHMFPHASLGGKDHSRQTLLGHLRTIERLTANGNSN